MALDPVTLPNDIAALKALLIAAEARAIELDGQIAQLKLTIAKMRRNTFGASSEKGARLLDQLELQLDELVASAAEAKAAAVIATQAPAPIDAEREKPARRPLPAHLPRERVEHGAPCTCRHCGSDRIRKLGEHTTETLERVPAHWKVITHVRETFTCRVWTLRPLVSEIEKHVLGAERIHGDDTTVPVLAKGKCTTGRLWTYVRDDRPFGGEAAPAALFYYSPDRAGQHPENHLAGYCGIMQADAYSGYNGLYAEGRKPGPILEAACWAHGRRKFFELADLQKAPIAIEAVRRIDEMFAIEREINGRSASYRGCNRGWRGISPVSAYIHPRPPA